MIYAQCEQRTIVNTEKYTTDLSENSFFEQESNTLQAWEKKAPNRNANATKIKFSIIFLL